MELKQNQKSADELEAEKLQRELERIEEDNKKAMEVVSALEGGKKKRFWEREKKEKPLKKEVAPPPRMNTREVAEKIKKEIAKREETTPLTQEEKNELAGEMFLKAQEDFQNNAIDTASFLRNPWAKTEKWWKELDQTRNGKLLKVAASAAFIGTATIASGVALGMLPATAYGIGARLVRRVGAATLLNMSLTSNLSRQVMDVFKKHGGPASPKTGWKKHLNLRNAAMLGGVGTAYLLSGGTVAAIAGVGIVFRKLGNYLADRNIKHAEAELDEIKRSFEFDDSLDIGDLVSKLTIFESEYKSIARSVKGLKWGKNIANGVLTIGIGLATMSTARAQSNVPSSEPTREEVPAPEQEKTETTEATPPAVAPTPAGPKEGFIDRIMPKWITEHRPGGHKDSYNNSGELVRDFDNGTREIYFKSGELGRKIFPDDREEFYNREGQLIKRIFPFSQGEQTEHYENGRLLYRDFPGQKRIHYHDDRSFHLNDTARDDGLLVVDSQGNKTLGPVFTEKSPPPVAPAPALEVPPVAEQAPAPKVAQEPPPARETQQPATTTPPPADKPPTVPAETTPQQAVQENIKLDPDAVVHKGEGIEHALRRQIDNNPKLAQDLGFKGDVNDKDALHEFSCKIAHRVAIDNGYIGKLEDGKIPEVRVGTADMVAYQIVGVKDGHAQVTELDAKSGMVFEPHKVGQAYEGKDIDKKYEYEAKIEPMAGCDENGNPLVERTVKEVPKEIIGKNGVTQTEAPALTEEEMAKETMRQINAQTEKEYLLDQEVARVMAELEKKYPTAETPEKTGVENAPEQPMQHTNIVENATNNPFHLSTEMLKQVDEAYENSVKRIFPENTSELWGTAKDQKASELINIPRDEVGELYKPLFSFLNKIKEVTGLGPKGRILFFRGPESIEDYMMRAMQKAAQMGQLDKLKF